MKQTYVTLALAVFMSLLGAKAFAQNVGDTFAAPNTDGVTLYYEINDAESNLVTVVNPFKHTKNYSVKYSGDIVIPATVSYQNKTYIVNCVGTGSFDESEITSIVIGENVTGIYSSFYGCDKLTSVTLLCKKISYCFGNEVPSVKELKIGKDVTKVSWGAFTGLTGLTSIVVDAANTVYDSRNNCNAIIETAQNKLVRGCQSTVIPDNIASIEYDAFRGCVNLKSIDIPSSVTSINGSAFENCTSLTSIALPASLNYVGSSPFEGCSSLTTLVINCKEIGSWLEKVATETITDVVIGETVNSIRYDASFAGFTNLTTLTLNCKDVGSRFIPSNLPSLKNLKFGKNVTSINTSSTSNCPALVSIVVDAENTVYDSRNNCNAVIETATNTLVFGCQSTLIPNTVTAIGSLAFANCKGLTSIVIPSSVTSIGGGAFSGCTGLTSVDVPSSVIEIVLHYISAQPFAGTPWYNNLPDGVFNIGSVTCGYKGEMPENTTLTITSKVIMKQAFYESANLKSVILGEGVKTIGVEAFAKCPALESVSLSSSVDSIEVEAFRHCPAMTSITVDAKNQKFDSRGNCNAVIKTANNELVFGCNKTIIPSTVKSIGRAALMGCGFEAFVVPEGVETIGRTVFYECPNLKTLTIANSVTSIGNECIVKCPNLETVRIGTGIAFIDKSNFDSCEKLKDLYCSAADVPTFSTSYYSQAFKGTPVSEATLHVPAASVEAYKASEPWSSFGNVVPTSEEQVAIDAVNFPDEAMRNALLSLGLGTDGMLSSEEIASTTSLDLSGKGISDLKGLSIFAALTELNISRNKIAGEAMDALVANLPAITAQATARRAGSTPGKLYVIDTTASDEGNAMTETQAAAAVAKGWQPYYNNGTEWVAYSGGIPSGIKGVVVNDDQSAPIYNLRGQQLATPQKGINIINGKKVIVK